MEEKLKKILNKLAEQADRLDKKGLKAEANRVDTVLKSLAETPGLYELLNRKPSEKPGMGRHSLEEMKKQPDKNEHTDPKPEDLQSGVVTKTQPKEVLPYTKEQLMNSIKRDPSQEEAIKSHLVPALNELVGGPEVAGSTPLNIYNNQPIQRVLDDAEKFGLIKKQQSWFEKIF